MEHIPDISGRVRRGLLPAVNLVGGIVLGHPLLGLIVAGATVLARLAFEGLADPTKLTTWLRSASEVAPALTEFIESIRSNWPKWWG